VADISPTATGLVVSGAGAILTAVFGMALKMLVMSDRKDDESYRRLLAELETARAERDAERAEKRELREKLTVAEREIALWRERRQEP
jgi:hypothetical protein